MTLGRQFKNTYWQNPDTGDVTDYFVPGDDYKPTEETNSNRRTNQQGMLFSPYAHTGLVEDPTVNIEDRNKAIKKSLSISDVTDYARRSRLQTPAAEGHIKGFVDAINTTDTTMQDIARTHAVLTGKLGRGKGHASFTSNNIVVGVEQGYEKVPIVPEGYKASNTPIFNEDFWTKGQYDKHNPWAREYYPDIVEAHKKEPTSWEIEEGSHKGNIRWKAPDGTIYSNNDLDKLTPKDLGFSREELSSYHDYDAPATSELIVDWLEKNNVVPNVFPGKGKSSEKHSAAKVKLENGPSDVSPGNYKFTTWHTRHEPDKSSPVGLPTRTYAMWDKEGNRQEKVETITHKTVPKKNYYVPVTSTLVHEIGHTYEPRGSSLRTERVRRRRASSITDPVAEGYADAHTDRTYHHRGQLEDVLHDADVRADKIKNSGYSSEYGNWNATERALYSAVRQHLATNPGDDLAIPNRQQLLESHYTSEDLAARRRHEQARSQRDLARRRSYRYGGHAPTNLDEDYDVHLANKLALGQMWEHLPEVRPVLTKLGFGRTASDAHSDYMSRTPSTKFLSESAVKQRTKNKPQAEQLSLIESKPRRKRS